MWFLWCQKDPTYGIFLKRGLFKDIKNDIPVCQTHKYTNTNTQIHMTKCQKDPTSRIYFKRGLFRDMKNDIPVCQTHKYKKCKYANTQIQHMKKFTVSGLGLGLGHNEITRLVFFHTIERSVLVPEWPTHNFWCFSSSF